MGSGLEHPLVRCSLWLHVGFVGASAMAVGVLQLFEGSWLSALALAFFGGLLAVVGWRRGRIVLESPESVLLIVNERPRQSVGARAETGPWTVNG